MVFDTEVIYHQDKGDWTRGVTEKAGSVGLVEVEALEEGDKAKIGQLTCLFEAAHRLLYAENDVRLSGFVLLYEGMEEEARQDRWGKKVSVDFYILRGGEGGFEVEIGQVNRPKEIVRRDNGIEEDIHTGEGSNKCGGRDGRFKTVAVGGATHYVSTLLTRLRPSGIAHTSSRSIYTPPSFGSSAPQCPTTLDNSPSATPCQAKEL